MARKLASSTRTPRGKFRGVNIDLVRKFLELQVAAFHNAIRLVDDAILLYEHQSYPTACFCAITAMEEIAKCWGLMIVLAQSDALQREGSSLEDAANRFLEEHSVKLKSISTLAAISHRFRSESIGDKSFSQWLTQVESGVLIDLRTRSLYAGEWKRSIMNPRDQITESTAFEQICAAIELAITGLDYYLAEKGGTFSHSKVYIIREKEEQRLRTELEHFKQRRHVIDKNRKNSSHS